MRVLLVKMSSMGDVIHTLPAVTDAMQAIPKLALTWLVEPEFAEIPAWHPAVKQVIALPLRKWRQQLFNKDNFKQLRTLLSTITQQNYDVVIDAQGLLKSAILSRLASSSQYSGFTAKTAREAIASIFYNNKIAIAKDLPAIERSRQLFAKTLAYQYSNDLIDYGINWHNLAPITANAPYLFFLHGTTWASKHWPETYWQQLATIAETAGYQVYMTAATIEQQARVQRLAAKVAAIKILPKLTITTAARYLKNAKAVVTVDTGFGHLAAAIGVPVVSLYGPTDPKRVGIFGPQQLSLSAQLPCSPCNNRNCPLKINTASIQPACFVPLSPQLVWDNLQQVMTK